MKYKDKYEQLYGTYQNAGKKLLEATENLADLNGFGGEELHHYLTAKKKYAVAEREFQHLLDYVQAGNVNIAAEYVAQTFMYEFIKADQRKRGANWPEDASMPSPPYFCTIGLTNDETLQSDDPMDTVYKFPVLNLQHGRECYSYLAQLLQGAKDSGTNMLVFKKIDEASPIYVKVEIRTR